MISLKEALIKAQSICSKQEKCIRDIMVKLDGWGLSEEHKEEVIAQLVKDKFIDEPRYAESFVNDKFRFNKWGKIKIKYQLMLKGISETDIENALQRIDMNEYNAVLQQIIEQKMNSLKNEKDPRKKYQKILTFTYNRGFSFEDSNDLIKNVLK